MFSSIFKSSKTKNPQQILTLLLNTLPKLRAGKGKDFKRAREECTRLLSALKHAFSTMPIQEQLLFIQNCLQANILHLLLTHIAFFEFEARKDAVACFLAITKATIGARPISAEHILSHPGIIEALLSGYAEQELALMHGMMLRECLKHEGIAFHFLHSPVLYELFEFVQVATFDIASDAFATLKDILSRHKEIVASFLKMNYSPFFTSFCLLLKSENYITRRQGLKLLGELLMEPLNAHCMHEFIEDAEHLKLLMNLLRDSSKNIQFEAFHIFKIFVAAPTKSRPVYDILLKNQRKLIDYIEAFEPTKDDDNTFYEEKDFILQHVKHLSPQQRNQQHSPDHHNALKKDGNDDTSAIYKDEFKITEDAYNSDNKQNTYIDPVNMAQTNTTK